MNCLVIDAFGVLKVFIDKFSNACIPIWKTDLYTIGNFLLQEFDLSRFSAFVQAFEHNECSSFIHFYVGQNDTVVKNCCDWPEIKRNQVKYRERNIVKLQRAFCSFMQYGLMNDV
jgi:hypothetical protein